MTVATIKVHTPGRSTNTSLQISYPEITKSPGPKGTNMTVATTLPSISYTLLITQINGFFER